MTQQTAPVPLEREPSFGFGDRLGLATPGHLAALRKVGGPIRGIFAQQSIRELARTNRSPEEVMQAAAEALDAADYEEPWSADADHVKTADDVRRTMAAGFVFFTLDPSDVVDQRADDYEAAALAARFDHFRTDYPWIDDYRGQTFQAAGSTFEFDEQTLARTAVKYGAAIRQAIDLAKEVQREADRLGQPFELELSVDETAQPTTPAEHFIIADQLRRADVQLVSLAPRFVGEFEKGVDFKGDLEEFEASLQIHAELARQLGPHKLSLHSGSDKLSIYSTLARTTDGLFHVKTAGTSYLEALRVVARVDEPLFREIITFSRANYDDDRATYHVSATLADAQPEQEIGSVEELERQYLGLWEEVPSGHGFTTPGRQIMHCTFGSVVSDQRLGSQLKQLLAQHQDEYTELLQEHFERHLLALR